MMARPPSCIQLCKGKHPLYPRGFRAAGIVWLHGEVPRQWEMLIVEIHDGPVRKDQPAGST